MQSGITTSIGNNAGGNSSVIIVAAFTQASMTVPKRVGGILPITRGKEK
jgi:hypothetical protein